MRKGNTICFMSTNILLYMNFGTPFSQHTVDQCMETVWVKKESFFEGALPFICSWGKGGGEKYILFLTSLPLNSSNFSSPAQEIHQSIIDLSQDFFWNP